MEAFEIADLLQQQERSGERYLEFLKAPAISTGIYALPHGAVDTQQPHTEDEVYYVIKGRGMIRVGEEDRPVTAGSMVYVDEALEHRFHSITEDLTILVMFAPPRRSRAS